jgi:hypothetical protein
MVVRDPPLPAPVARKPMPQPSDFPDWAALTAASRLWTERRPGRRGRVLIACNIGGHGPASMMESMLAAALSVRDADVEIVLCDGVLPGCLRAQRNEASDPAILVGRKLVETLCPGCLWRGRSMFEPLGLKVHFLSELVTQGEREEARRTAAAINLDEIPSFKLDGLAVGEHARAGALRYFARGDLEGEPEGEAVLRRFFEASLVSVAAYQRLLEKERFDVAVFHHGLYIPQGPIGEVCRRLKVRVVNWFVAYRANSFIFSHDDTYHHTLMSEPTSVWETMRWGEQQSADIERYLKSRWHGTRDWIGFHEKPSEDARTYLRAAGLDFSKPIIGMLTNVVWDAQLHYPANAFPSLIDWVMETIAWFAKRPDLQLLIRIHPAEIRGTVKSRQPMAEEIAKRFPNIPSNVFVIPPESDISTYAAIELCDCALIYGTKMGVELTAVGIPTIVAGEAWIKNKGLTLDASSQAEYFALLERLPLRKRLDSEAVDRAKKYAYHFFFRRMMPLSFMKRDKSALFYKVDIASADDLAPGRNLTLDRICDGILEQKPFVHPAEDVGVHDL